MARDELLYLRHVLDVINTVEEYLRGVSEKQFNQGWLKKLMDLLLEIKSAVEKALTKIKTRLSAKTLANFSSRNDALLKQGCKFNPAEAKQGQRVKRGRPKQSFAKNLLDRLRDPKEAVPAFMYDFNVPFENNQAARDIRMLKVKPKVSGCFRSRHGAEIFCALRGYSSTPRKNGQPVFVALHSAFCRQPSYPDFISLPAAVVTDIRKTYPEVPWQDVDTSSFSR